jgi:16S rRNA (guanine527-N7)-methyltransferase
VTLSSGEQRDQVLRDYNVSRETSARLDSFVAELARWQKIKNLIGPSALPEIWSRHIADSLQLHAIAPEQGLWLDIGSGGGFPGIVLAMLRTEHSLGQVHMIESNGRKCAFLRHVIRTCGLDAVVHEGRIEAIMPSLDLPAKFVSARALAPLAQLVDWSKALLRNGALGIFPKGQDVEIELGQVSTSWALSTELRQSQTDPSGKIVLVRMIATQGESHES